jgi:hypothetical protein
MPCLICRDLERAFKASQSEYIEARSSACYRVCRKPAAHMNVDMERAKCELDEHQSVCVSAVRKLALLPLGKVPISLRQLAA